MKLLSRRVAQDKIVILKYTARIWMSKYSYTYVYTSVMSVKNLTYDYSSLSKIQKNQVKLRHPVLSKGGVLKIFVFPPRILYS